MPATHGHEASEAADVLRGVGDLSCHAADYLHVWKELFSEEMQFAHICADRLLLGTLCVCVLLVGIAVAGNLMIAALLHRWLQDWASAAALTLLLNLGALFAQLLAMRAWLSSLSLPRSRRALRDLMQRLHATARASGTE
jgi:hypothetical protein